MSAALNPVSSLFGVESFEVNALGYRDFLHWMESFDAAHNAYAKRFIRTMARQALG